MTDPDDPLDLTDAAKQDLAAAHLRRQLEARDGNAISPDAQRLIAKLGLLTNNLLADLTIDPPKYREFIRGDRELVIGSRYPYATWVLHPTTEEQP